MDLNVLESTKRIRPLPFVAKKFTTMPSREGYAYHVEIYRDGKQIGVLHDIGDGGSAMARIYGDKDWDTLVKDWNEEKPLWGEENLIGEYFLVAELMKKKRRSLKDHLIVIEKAEAKSEVTISGWKINAVPWKKAAEELKDQIPEGAYILNEFKDAGW